ncbi:MAG: hypothetical protein OXG43_11130 [Chloroflexi bacterium]|nr:hypothetical protein [Chloroflexota bacterium]
MSERRKVSDAAKARWTDPPFVNPDVLTDEQLAALEAAREAWDEWRMTGSVKKLIEIGHLPKDAEPG